MDALSLLASIITLIQLAHIVQQSLEQVERVIKHGPESFHALQSEVTELKHVLNRIKDVHAKTPKLAEGASLGVRLGNLNSTLINVKELLADARSLVQVKDNGTGLSRSERVQKEDEVRRITYRIREEKIALTLLALSDNIRYV